jgi:hypothetical protein
MTIARQEELPGMTDRKLKDLHEAALSYAELRDARIAASTPEVKAKTDLLALMKSHKLEHYKYNGVEITVTHEKENVRVTVKAHDSEEELVDGKMRAANDDSMPDLPDTQRKAVKKVKTRKGKKGKK